MPAADCITAYQINSLVGSAFKTCHFHFTLEGGAASVLLSSYPVRPEQELLGSCHSSTHSKFGKVQCVQY